MTLFSEKDHAHLLKDPALTVLNVEGRPQVVFPYRLGAFPQSQPLRRDTQTSVRQGQLIMNGAPVVQQPLASLNGTAVSNQYQIKTMAPPALGPQMRISSNGGMRPSSVHATNLQNNGNIPHLVTPQPIPIPVSQHSPTSRAAIAMPHVDVQKPEVAITSAISNSTIPTPQPDDNAELTLIGSPARPKVQNPTAQQHGGLSVPTNGFHLTPMTSMTTPLINSAFGQNQSHTGGLSLQQMQHLKTAFSNIPTTDLAAVGRVISASYMNLAANGTNMNMQLPAGANMKMSPARQIQRVMNSASFQRPTSAANGTDGQLNGNGTLTANSVMGNTVSNSPATLRSPSANDLRTPSRNGVHGNNVQHPHIQPSSSPLSNNNGMQAQRSPRPLMASTVGMPSSLQQQQAIKTTQNGF